MLSTDAVRRFWAKVEIVSDMDCWRWIGALTSAGYGNFRTGEANFLAHRIAYELRYGRFERGGGPSGGLCVLHRCDNPPCVNPLHLYLGDQKRNMEDASIRGRIASGDRHGSHTHPERVSRGDRHYSKKNPELVRKGEKHPMALLSETDVVDIRAQRGITTGRALAAKYGVTPSEISLIQLGKIWRHVGAWAS